MAIDGLVKYISLALSWVFGLFFLLAGIASIFSMPLGGLAMVAISLLLLPPVRRFVYSKTAKSLSFKARASAIFVLLLTFGVLVNQGAIQIPKEVAATPTPPQTGAMATTSGQSNSAATKTDTSNASAPSPRSAGALSSEAADKKIGPDAVFLITQKGWERTYRTWGDTWIARINNSMPIAARKVAESPECDKLEIAGLSDQRSTPKQEIVYYADCTNGKRFYVAEKELQSTATVVSKNAKTAAISDSTAIRACEDGVKEQLKYPMSFDRKWTDTSVYRAKTGNIAVEFSFEAKNALGALLPQKARCVIDDKGIYPAEISPM